MSSSLKERLANYLYNSFPSTAVALLLFFVGTLVLRTLVIGVPIQPGLGTAVTTTVGGTVVVEYTQEGEVYHQFWGRVHRHINCGDRVYDMPDVSMLFFKGKFRTSHSLLLPNTFQKGSECKVSVQVSTNPPFTIGTVYTDMPEILFTIK